MMSTRDKDGLHANFWAAIIGTIEWLAPYFCYRFKNVRTIALVVCQSGTILAALLLWLLPRDALGGLLYATFTLASFGGSYAVLMGLQTANTAGKLQFTDI